MSTTKRIMDEIRAATGASEEDIKAMLSLHEGDANAAMLALLETPFQKVDGKKHKQQGMGGGPPSRQDNQGQRDRGTPSPWRDGYPSSGAGRGGRGGRGPGGEQGRGGGLPYSAGRGRGASVGAPRPAPKAPAAPDAGYSSSSSYPSAFPPVEPTAGSGHDDASGPAAATPTPPGGVWGAPAAAAAAAAASASAAAAAPGPSPAGPSSVAPPHVVGAWGAGSKTMAEKIKAKSVAPPAPAPAAPVYHPPVQPAPEPTPIPEPELQDFTYTSAGEYAEEEDHEEYATEQDVPLAQAPDPIPVPVEAPAPASAPPAIYPPTWSNADVAKNLLNSLTKGAAAAAPAAAPPAAAAPQQQTAQQAAQAHAAAVAAAAQVEEAAAAAAAAVPSASDAMSAPQATHYAPYSAAPPPKAATPAEAEAQSMQLSFGNFGLGELGGNFNAYAPPADPAASLMPQQVAMDPAAAGPHADAYHPSAYHGYGGYMNVDKMSAQAPNPAGPQQADASRQTSTNAPNTFSTFGHGSTGFGAAFGSNFASSLPEPSAGQVSYDAAQQAFGNYQEQLKQPSSYAGSSAPGMAGMAAYNMQQYQQQQQQQQQYSQPAAAKSMYSQYAQAAPQQQQAAPAPEAAAAAAAAAAPAAGPSGVAAGPSGMQQVGAAGVPHQMHFSNPQAAVAPGMAQYNPALYNQPYPQFTPQYMANVGYNAYNMGYGYQGVNAYPPQAASGYAPSANAAYSVPHTQHTGGPRAQQQYNPYSNPAQAAGVPGVGGAPAGYAAAGQAAAYGLTGYEQDMSSGAAGAINASSYGMGKDKDTNLYGGQQGGGYPQHARGGNNYGGGYPQQQPYVGQGGYTQGNKGSYGGGGGYNNRQQYNQQQLREQQQAQQQQQQQYQQQQYGGPGAQGGYSKGL